MIQGIRLRDIPKLLPGLFRSDGGAERARTVDLRLAKPALSQLSYSPIKSYQTQEVGQGRLELPTSRLSGVRSNHLSYWPDSRLSLSVTSRVSVPGNQIVRRFNVLVCGLTLRYAPKRFLRKEVIQPQVPLRLPCYDFTPVTSHSLEPYLPCGLAQALLEQPTPMV